MTARLRPPVGVPRARAAGDVPAAGAVPAAALDERVRALEAELVDARREASAARESSRQAHRDSARLVRLLTVLSRPAPDTAALLERALEALSEAFGADVVALVRGGAPGVQHAAGAVVVASCGFPRGSAPVLPALPAALAVAWAGDAAPGACASWSDQDHVPPGGDSGDALVVAGVVIRSGARLVLDPADAAPGALLVLRSAPARLTATELKLLQSVTERLHAALQATERRSAAELLASTGDRFTRHRDGEQLLAEAAVRLADLSGAEWAGVVEVDGARAVLRAQGGSLGLDLSAQWPRAAGDLLGWEDLAAGRSQLCHDLATVPDHPDAPPHSRVRTLLCVPVVAEGTTQALLYALHQTPSAFSRIAVEAVEQLAGTLSGALVSSRLHQALTRSEQGAHHRATHDALTGLANRCLFREELERRLGGDGADGADGVGVLFCDLDGFKSVNDRFGHDAGDQLLRQVAQRLRGAVRPGDVLARLGGDEFVVLVDRVADDRVVQGVADRLVALLAEPFELVGPRGAREVARVGASVGGALAPCGPQPAERAAQLLSHADAAMYEAKRSGGRRARTYDAAAAARATRRAELAHDVDGAVALGQVHVVYQPVWDLVADRAVGVEALARWTHPVHGPVPPDAFVPHAERTGAVVGLGRFVLRTALAQLVAWDAAGAASPSVSVNASPVELQEPSYAARVLADLVGHGVPPRRLAVEITEGLPLGGPELVQIAVLREAGVRVLIDDFGVSHSDLARLKHLPADGLKIDKSLVAGLSLAPGADPMDRGVVEAICTLARSTAMAVVAEGVETEAQREALVALGCRTAQGYLMGRPALAEDVLAVLRRPAPEG